MLTSSQFNQLQAQKQHILNENWFMPIMYDNGVLECWSIGK